MLTVSVIVFSADAFELKESLSKDFEPVILIEKEDSGITVDYTFSGAMCTEDDLYPGSFNISLPGFGVNATPGEAAWLIHWDSFEIPEGYTHHVDVVTSESDIIPFRLAPARPDLINSSDDVYSYDNVPPVQEFAGWIPQNAVEEGSIKIFRDRNILYIGVFPISYNISDSLLKMINHLTYKVSFIPSPSTLSSVNAISDSQSDSRHDIDYNYMTAVFTKIVSEENDEKETVEHEFDDSVYESQELKNTIAWNVGDSYLILSRNIYSNAVNKFAAWKKVLGFNVTIVMSDSWTSETIKSTIESKYKSTGNLKYLLLFGDEIDLPGEMHKPYDYPFYTDYFYACMDGEDDDLPDLFSGRISVSSSEEANTVVDKVITYEKFACGGNGKAIVCAEFSDCEWDSKNRIYVSDGFEDRRFTRTCEDIANGLIPEGKSIERIYFYNKKDISEFMPSNWGKNQFGYGEEIPGYLKNSVFNWKGDNNDIVAAINNSGVGYVLHRDHGGIQSWSNPKFTLSDVNRLNNGCNTPIIFSINCLTGMYQYISVPSKYSDPSGLLNGRSTCLAESFLRKKEGGGVAVIAASQVSYTQNNDVFAMEMFQLIWPSSLFCAKFPGYTPSQHSPNSTPVLGLGELLNASKLKLSDKYPGIWTTHNNQIYHLFGDPSMRIYEPCHPVSPNVEITLNNNYVNHCIINMSSNYRLVRIPIKGVGKVVWAKAKNSEYVLSKSDLSSYEFYIVGENVIPTPLSEIIENVQKTDVLSISKITCDNGIIRIEWNTADFNKAVSVSVRGVFDGLIKTVDCKVSGNKATLDMLSDSEGIYVVELLCDGKVVDSRKIKI